MQVSSLVLERSQRGAVIVLQHPVSRFSGFVPSVRIGSTPGRAKA
jgi:hypothetical protein